ncbi:MAG TPA: rod shape-determining protein MreC [Candidatus Paceibacterota bacterium]|nr:rod shape-determining protein MreC [Candidatus Paceibacterota bacterium]HPT17929.1 rod shape-determining protein MreC [Candidatus Paceibacterota bacterium]
MSYLLDKKIKRKKIQKIVILIVFLFLVFCFRSDIFKGLSSAVHFISRPVLIFGDILCDKFSDLNIYFSSKKSLYSENNFLKTQLNEKEIKMSNYASVLDENLKLKEILGRNIVGNDFIISSILVKPNRSLYDTMIIDVGTNDGVSVGKKVFAKGDIPLGYISETYANSSKIVLFSSPGEKTDSVISGKDVFVQLIGRGAGDFEMILPRDFSIEKGTEIVLPGIMPYVLARTETIISSPHDSYQKVLLISPINIFELKFVEVEK